MQTDVFGTLYLKHPRIPAFRACINHVDKNHFSPFIFDVPITESPFGRVKRLSLTVKESNKVDTST